MAPGGDAMGFVISSVIVCIVDILRGPLFAQTSDVSRRSGWSGPGGWPLNVAAPWAATRLFLFCFALILSSFAVVAVS